MHLNTTPAAPPCQPGKPCIRDLAELTSDSGLLPALIVPLMGLKQLRRRIREINATHPRYQEETPLVLAYETKRRQQVSGHLHVSVNQLRLA